MPKLYLFDADGTLTPLRGSSVAPFSFELLPGVAEKCTGLDGKLAIVSNQSGKRPVEDIRAQLDWTADQIGANLILWATTEDRRKPSPAMLIEAMQWFGVEPEEVVMVGDWETDRQAAEAAGVEFVWAEEFFSEMRGLSDGLDRAGGMAP
jgi:HAD superfamily hydrolase (TIGR01662 family)